MRWGIVVVVILAGCSPGVFADLKGVQTYTKETLLPAVGNGSLDGLTSDYFRKTSDPEASARWLRLFKQLGSLQSAGEPNCTVTSGVNTNPDLAGEFATCEVDAVYANGAAHVSARLRKFGEGWKVDAVNVNSDYFGKLMEKAAAPDVAAPAPATPVAPPPPAAPSSPSPT